MTTLLWAYLGGLALWTAALLAYGKHEGTSYRDLQDAWRKEDHKLTLTAMLLSWPFTLLLIACFGLDELVKRRWPKPKPKPPPLPPFVPSSSIIATSSARRDDDMGCDYSPIIEDDDPEEYNVGWDRGR